MRMLAPLALAVLATISALTASVPARAQQPAIFEVIIPAERLNMPVGFRDPEIQTIRQFLGRLTVRANGAVCLSIDLTASSGDAVMQLGLPGQASPCSTDGSTVVFHDGRGAQLATQYVLRKGTRETLINLAPVPPGGPTLGPPPTPRAPQPTPQASQAFTPPSTGDAGLASRRANDESS
jgi:hypothetical protein